MVHNMRKQGNDDLIDRIVYINRVAKVVKGGRRFHFTALVVVGDGNGSVGIGNGKATEVPEAIRKASEKAKRNMFKVPLVEGFTLPHDEIGRYCSTKVIIRPASEGTGVIAGDVVRAIMEAAGVKNVLTKVVGSPNPHNVSKAMVDALKRMVTIEEFYARRGKQFKGNSRTIHSTGSKN